MGGLARVKKQTAAQDLSDSAIIPFVEQVPLPNAGSNTETEFDRTNLWHLQKFLRKTTLTQKFCPR
jgi:hypothetical protein